MDSEAVKLVDLVVHELRTPLTVALGSLREIAEPADPLHQAALARAMRSCQRLEQLAADMREWTHLQMSAPDSGAVAMARVLAEAARGVSIARDDVAIVMGEVPAGLNVQAVPSLIGAALTALLVAVARAAQAGEVVTVEVVATDETATIVARRSGAISSDAGQTFDAEWVGGLGFSLPLARAAIACGGGTVTSRQSADGRLQSISAQLAVAPPGPFR